MSFKDLNLIKPLQKAVEASGYVEPTLVQQRSIPLILEGKDVIVSAQTGTGKTAAFALPILQKLYDKQDTPKKGKKIRAVILSPTRELALQIQQNFKSYAEFTNLTTLVVFGGASIEPQIDGLKKGVDILVATPGRLLDLHKQDYINLDYVETFVLDEADLMLDMGFIDDIKKVERLCPENKQTLLFSATIPNKIEELANSILTNPERIDVTPTKSVAKDVDQLLYYVPKRNKIELCLHLIRNTIEGNVLIFRRTKFGVNKLEETLLKNGFSVNSIHGDKAQSERQTALNKFKSGYVKVLIATDVAARGIDINELDNVLNFDMPNVPETYVHRIGRTGRAGHTGKSYSMCSADEKSYVKAIENYINVSIPVATEHPYPLDPKAKPIVHKKKGSKYKKGRKSEASKKKKKRWY
ncbi:ATP-dependent RNA helicase RhlE [Winogradskyella epiphytica]|uniref:DEAD-box ATP-dependent RNA helicase RhpA n=1 Tax=Winogradskyella epiphytica TaxID=262005 RepID=A0A2V4WUF7_9FLAO|nr:DEAD/DEAH box helicase [Winogradskyella epiphytica]PYE80068.1 ATP-dependent RNA helicase RhlE [Winogradskyella epiphytica]GGW71181.1 DEAD/DEAH box family ATP-dependent RNA helicase [Winogradskyella epiphytica]